MKIKIYRGQNQIGGSIISIASDTTRIILDVGIELDDTDADAPPIEGLFQGEPFFDGVFISHYHADHIGLAEKLLPGIDLYMGKKTYEIFEFSMEYMKKSCILNANFFYPEIPVTVGDITITPYLCDHSAFDSYMLLVECEGKSLLYTGDYRANGRKSYVSLINKLPQIDAIITEGTTLSRPIINNIKETELEKMAVELMEEYSPVFILQSATNIDRTVTFYKGAKKNQLLFFEDLYMAGITSIIGGHIPNPKTFRDVKVFMTSGDENRYKQLLSYGNKRVGLDNIAKSNFAMCVRPSMKNYLKKLAEKMSFNDGVLIYSIWSGYKEKKEVSDFLAFMESEGVTVKTLHTSGHADAESINQLINKTAPKWIIPVHTENADWFKKYKDSKVLLERDFLEI